MAQNLAFLLWQSGIERERWEEHLATVLGSDGARAWGVLTGDPPTEAEVKRACAQWAISKEVLLDTDLIVTSGLNVRRENLRRLLSSVPHGDKQVVAAAAGVNPTTLSTWESGAHEPRAENRGRLLDHLGVSRTTELDDEPYFLSPEPWTVYERRRWLKHRIDAASPQELTELFPALRRLLAS